MMRAIRYGLLLVGLAVLSFGGGIVIVDFAMRFVVGKGEEVFVPDLSGLDGEAAARVLEKSNLYFFADRWEHDAAADSGIVLRQRPEAGAKVKEGRRIAVTFSLGPERSVVPPLAGERVRQARIALADRGLRVGGELRVPHERVERDIVITTSPVAGTPVVAGDEVRLLVSLGPEPSSYLLPDLTGKSLTGVRRHLLLFELSLARVTYRDDPEVPAGTILEQHPPAGERIDREEGIELVVASP